MFDGWLTGGSENLNSFDKELLDSNLVGAKNLEELEYREQSLVAYKEDDFRENPFSGNFDYNYLKSIHKFLFEDVYTFAGKDRFELGYNGVFRKGESLFTSGVNLPKVSKALFDALKNENFFKNLNQKEFIKASATFFDGINKLHPFREGNGRTQRLFMEQLAKNAGYELDLSGVSQSKMYNAAIQGHKGQTVGYEIIIRSNIKQSKDRGLSL